MPQTERQLSLLVVDDEQLNRDILSRRLERRGFAVDVASDGTEALQLLDQREYDAVLLDTMMPGISGIEVLKTVRAAHSPAQLPVIMVTAVSDSSKIAEAIKAQHPKAAQEAIRKLESKP